jgi:hypothetical protein
MCDGMKIDRRLVLVGVMLIVLSMTMATQYATTKVSYSFAIVHPSNADIRFIASDNSSDDGVRCLRVNVNSSGTQFVTLELGDFQPNSQKNYTAAFGVVNEEPFYVNLTHVTVSGTNASYLDIWVHDDRDALFLGNDTHQQMVVNDGVALFGDSDTVWTLADGDGDVETMDDDFTGGGTIVTQWDTTANVQFSESDTDAANCTSDFVWIGVSLDIKSDAALVASATGTIELHFKASTND